MHWHGDDCIELVMERQGPNQQTAERPRQTLHFPVFEKMYQLAEGTFITAERVHGVKIHQALPADGTEVMLIQWIGVYERSSASSTEVLCFEWLGEGKAGRTDWDARYILERLLAQAAFIRKDEIEKSCGKAYKSEENPVGQPVLMRYDGASRETREDTPPLNGEYTTYVMKVGNRRLNSLMM
jgi:hypothetical protein